ncbi:hypothetical protein ACFY5F_28305 [Streptomyces sp. NPDC013161]|uniref:hypothetical protein n=1 Tax=Streptomyces sp. NPDC013161 TaxID=3364862 RepID=UPI0036804E1B
MSRPSPSSTTEDWMVYQAKSASQYTYTGSWNSGRECATQCFWGDDHWSDQAG